jgi:hypothetical protein
MGDCFLTPSWGGGNGFVEPRKWIAGGARTVSRNCGSFVPGHEVAASTKFRNQARAVAQAIVQVNHFADCENAL